MHKYCVSPFELSIGLYVVVDRSWKMVSEPGDLDTIQALCREMNKE